ncbi:MAG: hypothetical protein JKY48_17440 [Flavobacteriales bacterium]|nr:hypothetical protein [Flavobacteriales bacterium]
MDERSPYKRKYGRDPVQEKKDEKSKQQGKLTVKEFTDAYINLGRLKGKTFIDEEERYFRQDIWPVIGDKFMDDVSVDDIEQIQHKIIERATGRRRAKRNGKVAAKHAIACTRRLFNLALKKGHVTRNPVNDIEPLGITGKRSRILNFQEIWLFWNRIEMLGTPPVTTKALKFMLATMQRGIEVRNMRYSALKPDEKVWQMERHETKSGTMHRVPLNKYALKLIDEIAPFTCASDYVFGATRVQSAPKTPNANLSPLGKSAMPQATYVEVGRHSRLKTFARMICAELVRHGSLPLAYQNSTRGSCSITVMGIEMLQVKSTCSIPMILKSNAQQSYGNSFLTRS